MNVAWLAADDVDGARSAVDDGERVWSRRGFHLQHHWSLLSHCQIDLYLGDPGRALARIEERWSALGRSFLTRIHVVHAEALHLRARASLAAAADDAEGEARLRAAASDARALARLGAPYTVALSELIVAGLAARRGHRTEASARFASAAMRLRDADMQLFADACDRRRGELLGDDALVRRADDSMRRQSIADPLRMTRMLAPGFTP